MEMILSLITQCLQCATVCSTNSDIVACDEQHSSGFCAHCAAVSMDLVFTALLK